MEKTLQDRLDNWGRVMRVSKHGKQQFCAGWAKEYYRCHAKRQTLLAMQLGITCEAQIAVQPDVDDAMVIEHAVSQLLVFEQKQLLKFTFVCDYPAHWIKTKLKLRNRDYCLSMSRTMSSLKIILAQIEKTDTIRPHNNLHAGVDSAPIVRCSAALGAAIA